MIKLQQIVGLPTLQYHLDNKLTLSECIYRYSSESFVQLFTEARQALTDGLLQLDTRDKHLLETTDIGLYGIYEGQQVPLDLPMEYDNPYQPILEDIAMYGNTYENVNVDDSYRDIKIHNTQVGVEFTFTDKHGIDRKLIYYKGGSVKIQWFDKQQDEWTTDRIPSKYEDQAVMNTLAKILVKVILPKYKSFAFKAADETRYRLFRALIYNNIDTNQYNLHTDDSELEIVVDSTDMINEADYHGKEVQLNKPKRGGPKKFYVYVNNPKTGKVKKVNFGDTTGLSVKIDDPKARHAFAARHKCATEKNKLSPNYWGCSIGRYWKSLGGEKNFSGYW